MTRSPIRTAISLAILATAAVACSGWPPADPGSAGAASARACDRYAAPGGSNSARGSRHHPVRTPDRLERVLDPGETGCLRGGIYRFSKFYIKTPRVTVTSFRHEAVTLQGDIKVLPQGHGTTISGLRLDGAGGRNEIGPRIYADHVTLRRNGITNQHRGICILIGKYFSNPAPRHVRISHNRIHDCGLLPATNHQHGIYVAEAHGTVIHSNWIYNNADRGIQLYPDAHNSLVSGNVIDGNGHGVAIGGDGSGGCSNDNTVTHNVIANSVIRWNVYSGTQGQDCTGNVVRRNCVFAAGASSPFNGNGGIETPSRSLTAQRNRVANPLYVNAAAGDFRLRPGSRCSGLLHNG